MAQRLKTDRILFMTVVLMVLFGALMVYSASSVVAESTKGSSYYFAMRQLIWVALSIPLMLFFKNLHYRKLQTPEVAFTAMALIMVLLVVVYFARQTASLDSAAEIRASALGVRKTGAGYLSGLFHRPALECAEQQAYAGAGDYRGRDSDAGGGGGGSWHGDRTGADRRGGVLRRRSGEAIYRLRGPRGASGLHRRGLAATLSAGTGGALRRSAIQACRQDR